jgi:hypothetical protein
MALSANTLPSVTPTRSAPFDLETAFTTAAGQTLTATGYVNNNKTQIDIGPGVFDGVVTVDVSALDVSSGDETYRLVLFGSNDAAFTNGNQEILGVMDFAAATAGRLVATIPSASPTIPATGKTSSRFYMLFTNHKEQYVFRYIQFYLVAGGTTPSITLKAWVAQLNEMNNC